MNKEVIANEIRKLIAHNKTADAIEYLAKYHFNDIDKELIILNNRFNKIKEEERLGVIEREMASQEYNKINVALVDLSAKIEQESKTPLAYKGGVSPSLSKVNTTKDRSISNVLLGIIVILLTGLIALGYFVVTNNEVASQNTETVVAPSTEPESEPKPVPESVTESKPIPKPAPEPEPEPVPVTESKPVPSVELMNSMTFTIRIKTKDVESAGTKGHAQIRLYSDNDYYTSYFKLAPNNFGRGSIQTFVIEPSIKKNAAYVSIPKGDFGSVNKVRLNLTSEKTNGWCVESVEVWEGNTTQNKASCFLFDTCLDEDNPKYKVFAYSSGMCQ